MTNDVFHEENKHYITLFVRCEMEDETAQPEVRRKSESEAVYFSPNVH